MKYLSKEVYILEGSFKHAEISETEFRKIILEQGNPAVVTFSSDWMGGAAMLNLIMEDLRFEYKEKAQFFWVNIERSQLATEFCITNTATICFFNNGEMTDQQIGLVSKDKLRKKVEKFIQRVTS